MSLAPQNRAFAAARARHSFVVKTRQRWMRVASKRALQMSAVVLAAKVREEWAGRGTGKRNFKGNGEGQTDDENAAMVFVL